MENHNSCNAKDGKCSSCASHMMIMIPLLLLIAGGVFAYYQFSGEENSSNTSSSPVGKTIEKTAEKTADSKSFSNAVAQDYSEANFKNLLGKEKFALYFYADWCPSCRATNKVLKDSPQTFGDAKILRVNYDNADALKKQYNITSQHTFVFFNADGSVAKTMMMPSDEAVSSFFAENTVSQDSSDNSASVFEDFSKEKFSNLLGKKPVALFFHASWCPTCRAEESLMKEHLSHFPAGTTILKADFDTETELKKQYNIAMQSIVVVLDASGKEVGRIGDFSSALDLKALLEKAL